MPQFTLPLSLPAIFAEDNFFVSGCNREAYTQVTGHNAPALVLFGPKGSGKSHLGHIWAARHHAAILDAAATALPAADAITGHLLLENIDSLADERALFHLLNYSKEHGRQLLLTSALPPRQLPFTLPDLTSRLLALPLATIAPPDDEVLAAAMRKQFADRQLKVADDVIAYLVARIERSFAKVTEMVELLDRQALAEQKSLTIPYVRKLLG